VTTSSTSLDKDSLQRKQPVRVIALLDSLARVGVSPSPLRVLHELAYLANVLAPVFELSPLSASLLKRRGGPYYPELQHTVDRLIGSGVVLASNIRFVHVPEEWRYRLDATYKLNGNFSDSIAHEYRSVYADTPEVLFLDELVAAYSTMAETQFGRITPYDPRYAHTDVDANNVIDFGEWVPEAASNFSRNAALTFGAKVRLQPAERLYLYLDHLKRRAASGE
jgi:hypothetical protein